MMGINQFCTLDTESRAQMAWDLGKHLAIWKGREFTYSLYFLQDFYVEVVIDSTSYKVTEVAAFKKGARFEKYLSKIQLGELSV